MTNLNLQSRRFFITWNNYTDDDLQKVKAWDYEWIYIGFEHAPTTGTKHMHIGVVFKKRKRVKQVLKLTGTGVRVDPMNGTIEDVINYCSKECEDCFEAGDRPTSQYEKSGEKTKKKWDEAKKAAIEGRFDDIPTDLYVRYKHSFEEIHFEAKQDASMTDVDDQNIKRHFLWLWGPSGTGKSHTARRIAKELGCDDPYLKDLNKWWNGYERQKVTIIEEADPKHCEHLASFFKKWCDKWSFTAECKGKVIAGCRPQYIIVTSNYSIQDCFPNIADFEPLKRRFCEIEVRDRTFQVQWPETRTEQELGDVHVQQPMGNIGNSMGCCTTGAGVEPGSKRRRVIEDDYQANPFNL